MNVLVTAASHEGSTLEVAEAIAGVLRRRGLQVTVATPDAIDDVAPFDAVVAGSAVYERRWLGPAVEFIRSHAATLATRPVWLFSSGPVGDPKRAFVRQMTVDPIEVPVLVELTRARGHRLFGGKFVRESGPWSRRLELLVFRGIEGDWRDWDAIEAWAGEIADALAHADWFRRLDERAG